MGRRASASLLTVLCRAVIVLSGLVFRPARAGRRFDHAADVAQPGDGGAHGVGQPSKTLPDLGDRSALGSLEHADQHCPLRAGSRQVGAGDTHRRGISILRSGFRLQSSFLRPLVIGNRNGAVLDAGFWQLCRRRVSVRRGPTRPRPRFALARLVRVSARWLSSLAGAQLVDVLCWFAALLFGHNRAPSGSASRPSRCLHHHKPGHLGPGGAATQQGPSTWTAMLPVRGKSSKNVSGCDFYWIALMHRRRAREARFAQGSASPQQADQSASSIDRLFCAI